MKPYAASRFLEEIPSDLIDHVGSDRKQETIKSAGRWHNESRSRYALSDSAVVNKPKKAGTKARYDWKVGDTAVHNLWGKGKVVAVMGKDKNMMIKVDFQGKVRQLMVTFAPIRKEE